MKRGDVWLAEVGGKRRPVVVLTRTELVEVRELVTIVEVTTSIRGTPAEVPLDAADLELDRECVINCDGLHTYRQRSLTKYVGRVGQDTLHKVCAAASYAIGC